MFPNLTGYSSIGLRSRLKRFIASKANLTPVSGCVASAALLEALAHKQTIIQTDSDDAQADNWIRRRKAFPAMMQALDAAK